MRTKKNTGPLKNPGIPFGIQLWVLLFNCLVTIKQLNLAEVQLMYSTYQHDRFFGEIITNRPDKDSGLW